MTRRNGAIVVHGAALYRRGQYRLIFDAFLIRIDCSAVMREVPLVPGRRWRADLAWPDHHVAVELQGGVYTRGHHVRGRQYEEDCEKVLQGTAAGWRVILLTWSMIAQRPQEIAEALNKILSCTNPAHRPGASKEG